MADVEQRAEAEATAKGLSGQARKSYIGGVFNKIREAHARVVKPGKSKTFVSNLNRRNRQLVRARYQEALAPHEEAVAALKQQRRHELAQVSYEKTGNPSNRELERRILTSPLKPIRYIETGDGVGEAMARGVNRNHLRDIYGQDQLSQALDLFPTTSLREEARRLDLNAGGNREALIARLAAPAAAKPPKRAPAERQRQRAIAQAIQHGAPDFPPGTLAAAQGKPAQPAAMARPATKVVKEQGARLSVRPHMYHGTQGYLISGTTAIGQRISIFSRTKAEAERMRDDIKAGREAKFDSEQKGGGDGQQR